MSILNVLVEELGQDDFKCMNTIIMEKLKPADLPYTKENSGWHFNNLEIWKKYQNQTEHFKFISVKDFKEEDNQNPTIYLITVPYLEDHLNVTWIRYIPDVTRKLLIEKKIPIVLSQPHEYFLGHTVQHAYHHFRPSEAMAHFSSVLDSKGLTKNDIIIHGISGTISKPGFFNVGSRKVYEAYCYDYFKSGRGFLDDYSGQNLSHPTMARYKFLTRKDHINFADQKDKISVCFNRQPRDIRCLVLLSNADQLDTSVFTFLAEEPLHVPMCDTDIKERLEISLLELPNNEYTKKLRSNIPLVIKKLNSLKLDERPGERLDHMNSNYVLNQERKRAWFEMVTETHEWTAKDYSCFIISEKTLWPILNNMPFCVQGHRENYEFLKNLGFDLFEETLLMQEATKRDLVNDDLDMSCLYATNQMYERFNAYNKNVKYLMEHKDRIQKNFKLLTETNWHEKEKNDLLKICKHSKNEHISMLDSLENKFKF